MLCHFLRFDRHISIHALLAESDPRQYARRNAHMYFYPRSPCGERRVGPRPCGPARIISIHALLAESDGASRASSQSRRHFYPRSPCGERRQSGALPQPPPHISIHALLAESDRHWQMGHSLTRQFLSTLSLRRATGFFGFCWSAAFDFYPRSPCGERPKLQIGQVQLSIISIHALLAESDPLWYVVVSQLQYFYPRSPCGERQCARGPLRAKGPFLSTLSLRRATAPPVAAAASFLISIHALLAESDCFPQAGQTCHSRFLSTLSLRRATHEIGQD